MIELFGDRVRLRTTTADDRDALLAIRRTPEVFTRWRGRDLDAEFDADLGDEEEHQLAMRRRRDG